MYIKRNFEANYQHKNRSHQVFQIEKLHQLGKGLQVVVVVAVVVVVVVGSMGAESSETKLLQVGNSAGR